MKRTTAGFIGMTLLLGGLLWVLYSGGGQGATDPSHVLAADAEGGDVDESGRSERFGSLADGAGAVDGRSRVPSADGRPKRVVLDSQPPETAHPPTRIALAGRVDLYRDGSLSDARLNGTIAIRRMAADWTTVKLEEGQFELVLHRQPGGGYASADDAVQVGNDPERLRFEVAAPKADGLDPLLHYFVDTGAPRRSAGAFPFGTEDVVITVTEAPALTLEVFEENTRIHLDQVTALSAGEGGIHRSLGRPGPSPLRLVPGELLSHEESALLAVSVPGYVHEFITVDFTRPHTRVVEMRRSGSLVVNVVGDVAPEWKFSLSAPDQPTKLRQARNGPQRFNGLAPATYTATVFEPGVRGFPQAVFATASVDVNADTTAHLTLEVTRPEAQRTAGLAGMLILPPEWSLREMSIHGQFMGRAQSKESQAFLILNSDLSPVTGRAGYYAFERKNLEVGRYLLELESLGVQTVVDLLPEGVRDVELVVSPPVRVTVVPVNALKGDDIAESLRTILWYPKRPDEGRGGNANTVGRDVDTGKFHLVVPAGQICIEAGAEASRDSSVEVFATEGLEVVLPVASPMTAMLELRDGESVVPWPLRAPLRCTSSNAGSTSNQIRSGRPPVLEAHRPGTYRVAVPEVDGYERHEDVEIEMAPGPMKAVVVQLVRR